MSKDPSLKKSILHTKNRHQGRYDLEILGHENPKLLKFILKNKFGDLSIDFADPNAVKELNRALLAHFYQISNWDIPSGYLCPPIPGRADYLHYLQDLLLTSNHGKSVDGKRIAVLDIGTGANCIYPLLGNAMFGWKFTASDIDEKSLQAASANLLSNPQVKGKIQLKHQPQAFNIFKGIISEEDLYELTLCNPPFHESKEAAAEGSSRKVKNLTGKKEKTVKLNFGGQSNELWCEGGELEFIRKMIQESQDFKDQVYCFTSLVSKKENLKSIYKALKDVGVAEYKTIDMAQGNKQSRFVAWSFLSAQEQENWRRMRWIFE